MELKTCECVGEGGGGTGREGGRERETDKEGSEPARQTAARF